MQIVQKLLTKTFRLKSNETSEFLLLFFHSFFVGLFIAFYFVQANSVFIRDFGSEQLPYAYMLAGLAGYLISTLYSALQARIKSKHLFLFALSFMLLVTLCGRLAAEFFPGKYLSFFVFIWAWPFISLVGTETGGLVIKMLNLVQVKRLFGMINMGGVIASILGYLLVPVLIKHIGSSYNLLLISVASLVAAIFVLFRIYKKIPEEKAEKKSKKKKQESGNSFKELLKENYFKLIFLSAIISMTVIYITDFGFLAAIKVQQDTLFAAEGSVAAYMALVFAGLKVGELIISYFSGRILVRYGVKVGLIVLPLTITLIISAAVITGFTVGVTSLLFLALMTLNKSMERIMRRGIDDPTFNILYQPLPPSRQLAVQSKVGIVMQLTIGLAGLFLLSLNLLLTRNGQFHLQYFPVFFLPLLILWIFVARRLYLNYRKKLREILKEISKKRRLDTSKYKYGTEVLAKRCKSVNDKVVKLSVSILAETNPRLFEPYVSSLIKKEDTPTHLSVLRSITPVWRERLGKQIENQFKNTENKELKLLAEEAVQMLDFKTVKELQKEELEALSLSDKEEDKLELIKYLVKHTHLPDAEQYIQNLFDKSKSRRIKISVVELLSKTQNESLLPHLTRLLKSPQYYHTATATILDIGEKALPYLDKMFDETKEENILLKIIEIYAKMGSSTAKSLIVKHINYPSRKVQLAAIWALFYCKYQAPEEEQGLIKDKIRVIINNLLTILLLINSVKNEKNTLKLFLALDQEREVYYELLFNLLSFLHEPRIINLIKKNIVGKNTIYALELIDNFILPELKPYIVPIFDDISVQAKIKKLSKFFPLQKLSFKDGLRALIRMDYDQISTWSIAKTLEMMERVHQKNVRKIELSSEDEYDDIKLWTHENTERVLKRIEKSELPDEVFLCLFHPDKLVYSTAAKIIYDENPQKCIEYLRNMSAEKQALARILRHNGILLQDKVKLLKRFQMFYSIPENLLVELACITEPISLMPGEKIFVGKDCSPLVIILIRGSLLNHENPDKKIEFENKAILTSGVNIPENLSYLEAGKKTVVLQADKYEYYNLLVDNTNILQHVFDSLRE